ncbi:MAG: DUF7379 domain-containing protein [Gemmatimonadaceae bacterium]
MPTIRRASGITVETSGDVTVTAAKPKRAPEGPVLSAPRSGRRRGGAARKAAAAPGTHLMPNESEIIAKAMADQELKLVDSIPLAAPTTPRAAPRPGEKRRRRAAAGAAEATLVGVADIGVPLSPNERAVILLEQDGVYTWHVAAEEVTAAAPSRSTKRKGARRAAAKTSRRVAHFRIDLAATLQPAPRPGRRRLGIFRKVLGKAVAYVFRIIAKPILTGITKFLERDVAEGLVHVSSGDPSTWTRDSDQAVSIPKDRAARVLLLVHGTFSSTLGSFGGLAATGPGKQFLDAALRHYDLIIGWDHKTLSVTPTDNARDLIRWLQAQKWPKPPNVDCVAFSRGGLVFRSLVEELLPSSGMKLTVGRAVFVGCTNGGTELARPANWRRFADVYINVAAAGVRALAIVPGFGAAPAILSEAIRGVGSLVKVLATAAIDDGAIPGLAAMNPGGAYVRQMNMRQEGQPTPDQVYYCAITSNFDPDMARDLGHTNEIPPGLLLKVFDKATDVLYGKPNDLVVHVEAMTQIDPGVGVYVRERLDYGTNGTVHHCRYFAEPATAESLRRWLKPVAG